MREIRPPALDSGVVNPPAGESQQQQRREPEQKRARAPGNGSALVRLTLAEQAGFQLGAAAIESRGVAGECVKRLRLLLFDDIQSVLKHAAQLAGRSAANE